MTDLATPTSATELPHANLSEPTLLQEVLAPISADLLAGRSNDKKAARFRRCADQHDFRVHRRRRRQAIASGVLLLIARALGYCGEKHIDLAVVIEFIHTATLLHDDVVDESDLRRGRSTANSMFGNAASVLVGDFLYSRSFQMMVEAGNARVMRIMADATNRIAEGEVLQLLNVHDPSVNEDRYFDVVERKTATLFRSRRAHRRSHRRRGRRGREPVRELRRVARQGFSDY